MELSIAFEHLARVDGSASFGFGRWHSRGQIFSQYDTGQHAQATASVSGPIEVRIVAEQPSKATIEVAVRPISGVAATDSKAFAATILSCILPCCILTQNPRTLIQLVVQARIVCNKDTLLASMINASTLALVNAGSVPMRGVVCAVSVGKKKDGYVVDETEDTCGCFAFMFTEGSSSCVWASWRGEDLISAREFANSQAYQVWHRIKENTAQH